MQKPAQSYPKPQNNMTEIVAVSLLQNLDRSHNQCNVCSLYLEQTFVCGVDIQLVFKNVRKNKKAYLTVNLKKYPWQIKHPVIDLKMELLIRLLTNLNCNLFLQKDPFYMCQKF